MPDFTQTHYTAFEGPKLLISGSLLAVALAAKAAVSRGSLEILLVFDDRTGRVIDLDLSGTAAEVSARYLPDPRRLSAYVEDAGPEAKGRGRPKLGVTAREVTLLPRHWDWLAAQPGGASAALRRLVEEARKKNDGLQEKRQAQQAAYGFIHAMAGDLPGFEEASRALFAGDAAKFRREAASWPTDVRTHAAKLARFEDAQS